MTEDKNKQFVEELKNFYEGFFDCVASSVEILASIQKSYKDQYELVLQFNEDPRILEELIKKLPAEKQATLLRLLLAAGDFGRRFNNLMEMTPKQKRQFADDLRKFAKELTKM